MWTRKDIREFKESICKEGKDSIIKIGHGETVTVGFVLLSIIIYSYVNRNDFIKKVRVPTVDDGSCLFWEFATDSYDVGFGLFFEWTKSPSEQQVSVHISDSEDEDDESDGENGERDKFKFDSVSVLLIFFQTFKVTEDDVEQGGVSSKSDLLETSRPPLSVIIPVYRRDCQVSCKLVMLQFLEVTDSKSFKMKIIGRGLCWESFISRARSIPFEVRQFVQFVEVQDSILPCLLYPLSVAKVRF